MRIRDIGLQRLLKRPALAGLSLLVMASGCAINRPVDKLTASCKLPAEPIQVVITEDGAQDALAGALPSDSIGLALLGIARTKAAQPASDGITHNLVLSGGGQHGAFGSGFLKGMQSANALPQYDIVTGVSTGALQATFAFLGNEDAPTDRLLNVNDDFPSEANTRPRTNVDDLVAGYTITREKTLYEDKGTSGIIRGAAKGSLAPLGKRLNRLITRDTLAALQRINNAPGKPRKLFVAILNYETGKTEAVDMTALAARLNENNFPLIQHCYNQVLIAASSEPIGALPVEIDGTLYVDAGLRYGVFLQQFLRNAMIVSKAAAAIRPKTLAPAPSVQTDIIVNGDLSVGSAGDTFKTKFSALDIAGRGRKILVNQIYRFSVADIIKARSTAHRIRFASIRVAEENAGVPIEGSTFDPAYMRRMIMVGKMRGATDDWQALAEVMNIQ
jgi:predicted acylesterase/phospholipase RssA